MTSPEVQYLRAVRDHFVRRNEVGHAFFEGFFSEYYSFSPQVCTVLAGDQPLTRLVLDGFVVPVLSFWQLMIERSDATWDDADLGAAFVRCHPDRAAAGDRLAAIREMVLHMVAPGDYAPPELVQLLLRRAWPNEHIQWALVRPVAIYQEILACYVREPRLTRSGGR